jgi:hypothetical protein
VKKLRSSITVMSWRGYCVLEEKAVVEEADTRVLLSLALTASRIRVTSIENMSYYCLPQVESNAYSSSPLSISENKFQLHKMQKRSVSNSNWVAAILKSP